MGTSPVFIATPKQWQAALSAANTNRDGTGTLVDVIPTPGSSGSRVDRVRVQSIVTTTAGVIRLYLYDGTNNYLLREILVTAVTPSTSLEAWSADVDLDGLILPSGWKLRASTHNAEAFRIFARGGDF